jgi:nucleoid-associated protein YgaU
MIGAMTERSATGTERQAVCPFVAFEDDRDYRSAVPDHRHRCFAESPSASRALAHQAAYCLSSSFPGCPTFMDWARREAAPPREQPTHTLREAPTAPRQAERVPEPAGRPVVPQAAPSSPPPRRARAEWTAPPPWAADAGTARPGRPVHGEGDVVRGGAVPAPDAVPAREDEDAGPGLGAWSGSALGSLAASGGRPVDEPARPLEPTVDVDRVPGFAPPEPAAPAFLAGRSARLREAEGAPFQPADADASRGTLQAIPPRRGAVGYTPGDPTRSRPPGRGRAPNRVIERAPDRAVMDPAAPSWERPRRFEAYPSLKSSGGGLAALPRPALYGLIVLVVAIALFATPFLLRGLTSGGGGATASPTPSASASPGASAAPSATPAPSPSPTVYTVKAGDTLSRIAAKYGLTVDQIVKANPQIKNPDKLALGDQIVIPPAVAPAITDDGTLTPAPSSTAP